MDILEYDEKYQNEQSNSAFFQQHLEMVYDLLKSKGLLDGKVTWKLEVAKVILWICYLQEVLILQV